MVDTNKTVTNNKKLLIVTGYAGAGKSSVLDALEDNGYYCVDNLPIPLLSDFISLVTASQYTQIALGIDVREGHNIHQLLCYLEKELCDLSVQVIFLTASYEVLIRRFQETRRKHPLANGIPLTDALAQEQLLLQPLKERADIILNTDQLTIHELRSFIANTLLVMQQKSILVNLVSFGFKYGIPIESNYIFDLRSLPNPYFIPALKLLDGTNEEIQHYLFEQPIVQDYWQRLESFVHFSIDQASKEGRNFINIGIGCTGGRHRSVAFVHKLNQQAHHGAQFIAKHRDKEKSGS